MAATLENSVRERWKKGIPTINGWLTLPIALSAEIMARAGFDSITIDMQHGAIDYGGALQILTALTASEVTPLVRVPNSDPTFITRVLDWRVRRDLSDDQQRRRGAHLRRRRTLLPGRQPQLWSAAGKPGLRTGLFQKN